MKLLSIPKVLRSLALVSGTALAFSLAVGCGSSGSSSSSPTDNKVHAAPSTDAVTVDFFAGGKVSAACSGTMLSSNVVLTAAHCADNSESARVRAPNGKGAASDVAQVLRYDWGQAASHAQEHDLALLVLRTPIEAAPFATVAAGACPGCNAVAFGRAGQTTTKSGVLALDTQTPTGRPFALRFTGAPAGAVGGGGVKSQDGTLVGVFMGRGATSTDGYVARIDMAEIQIWMASVVGANGSVLATTAGQPPVGSVKAASVRVLNTGGGSGGTGGATGNGPDDTSDGSNDTSDPAEDVGDESTNPDGSGGDQTNPDGFDNKTQTPTAKPPAGQARIKGDNYWFSSTPNDPAFKNDIDYAKAHTDATLVGAHGAPGYMTDIPDNMTMKALTMGKTGPLIVDSCYAGAKDKAGGISNAAELADNAGIPRSNSYGCSGEESTPSSSTLYCDGTWTDGNGKAVSDAQRTKYGMKNCKVSARNSKGAWTKYACP